MLDIEQVIIYGFVGQQVNCILIRRKWEQHSVCHLVFSYQLQPGLVIIITYQ